MLLFRSNLTTDPVEEFLRKELSLNLNVFLKKHVFA